MLGVSLHDPSNCGIAVWAACMTPLLHTGVRLNTRAGICLPREVCAAQVAWAPDVLHRCPELRGRLPMPVLAALYGAAGRAMARATTVARPMHEARLRLLARLWPHSHIIAHLAMPRARRPGRRISAAGCMAPCQHTARSSCQVRPRHHP